jgi:hypothetical protein
LKRNRFIFYILAAIVLVIFIEIIRSSLSQPGLEQFAGKYQEVGFFRNENNTGPVVRIYAVRALDGEDLSGMKDFGDLQPHTKYGRTLVFFFSENIPNEVKLSPVAPYFPQEYKNLLLAKFERTPMGEGRFEVIPL